MSYLDELKYKEENEFLELKQEISNYSNQIVRNIISFMNSAGGYIFIGVTDDMQIKGVANFNDVSDAINNSIIDNIRKDLVPTVMKSMKILKETKENKDVLIISIAASNIKIFNKKNQSFIRVGSTTRKITKDNPLINKYELTITSEKFEKINFRKLLKFLEIDKERIRKSYNLVDEKDFLTIFGKSLEDNNDTIKFNDKSRAIVDIPDIEKEILSYFGKINVLVSGRKINIFEHINNFSVVTRELLINAVVHSNVDSEIHIKLGKNFIYINNYCGISFFKKIKENNVFSSNERIIKQKLYHKLGFMESENQGYKIEIPKLSNSNLSFKYSHGKIHILFVFNYNNLTLSNIPIDIISLFYLKKEIGFKILEDVVERRY